MNKTLFAPGLVIVGIDAIFLLMDVIESGVAAAIAASGASNIKRMR